MSAPSSQRVAIVTAALAVIAFGVGAAFHARGSRATHTPPARIRPASAIARAHGELTHRLPLGGGPREGAAVDLNALPPLPMVVPPPHHPGDHDVSPLDQPMNVAWPMVSQWNDAMEREYGQFITQLGRGISARRCHFLDDCLQDPSVNALYDPATDAHINLGVDCADLPYILRAYFAFKRRLPFGFVSAIRGKGPDPRYALQIRPVAFKTWREYHTPRQLFSDMVSMVHSGMYRTAPGIEDSDFYSVSINRAAVHPGSVYYDPNGHVLIVSQVRADGAVYFIDGHPGGGITWKRFGQAFAIGTARLGGGFRNFRPIVYENARIVRTSDHALRDFDGRSQYNPPTWVIDGQASTYHAWVRVSLAEAGVVVDPVMEFREQIRALCRDVADRQSAIEFSQAAQIEHRAHPDGLPENIYGTMGDWELYSTPSRDARLKASFRELRETVGALPNLASLSPTLQTAWREETAQPDCQFAYTNSAGAHVALNMDVVLDRLFEMSFDPYNCPELRWGAPTGSPERNSCIDDPTKLNWYLHEQRLRNQIDREYGRPTGLEFGPASAPDVDVRRIIGINPSQG